MNSVQTKTMFSKVVDAAANIKRQIAVNLCKGEKKAAEKVAQTPSLNGAQFEAGIDTVKNSSEELAVPSTGTLRAYAGIDQPIVSRFPSKPGSAIKQPNVSYSSTKGPDGLWKGAITTNKELRTIDGRVIPAGTEITPSPTTWQFSKIENGRLTLKVRINGRFKEPEELTFETNLSPNDLVFKGPASNYIETDIPVIANALNSIK